MRLPSIFTPVIFTWYFQCRVYLRIPAYTLLLFYPYPCWIVPAPPPCQVQLFCPLLNHSVAFPLDLFVVFESGLLLNLELTNLVGEGTLGFLLSLPLCQYWAYRWVLLHSLLTWVLGV